MKKRDFDKDRRDRFNWSDDLPIIEYEDDGTDIAKLPKKGGNMTLSKMIGGMRGVYLVAAELSRLGFIVSVTSRGAAGADLLVTDELCKHAYSLQVKTNARIYAFWLLSKKCQEIVSPSHIYVLVNIKPNGQNEYFIVPSNIIVRDMEIEEGKNATFYSFSYSNAEQYKDRWDILGKPDHD
jgi:hypothetical protein